MAADTDGIHVGYNDQGTYDGRYPPDWDARKEAVKQRDHYTCQDCSVSAGEGKVLDVHHTTPLSEGGSNRLRNLELLCVDCHNARHDHDITDGRDRHRSSSGGEWLELLGAVVFGLFIGFLFHLLGISFLLTEPVGSLLWFAGTGYLFLLVVGILLDPREITVGYTLLGGIAVVIMNHAPMDGADPMRSPTVLLSMWIPALVAVLWWWMWRPPSSQEVH